MVLRTITHQTDPTTLYYNICGEKKPKQTRKSSFGAEIRSGQRGEICAVASSLLRQGRDVKSEQRAEGLDLRLPGKQGAECQGSWDPDCSVWLRQKLKYGVGFYTDSRDTFKDFKNTNLTV